MKFVNNFGAWVMNEYSDFEQKSAEANKKSNMEGTDRRYYWHTYKNKTIILDMETGKTGVARCKDGDKYSFRAGIGIAWAKLKGEEIPVERTETAIKNLKFGDKFIFFGSTKVYTFIYYYNVDSIERCFCASGEYLEESFSVNPDRRVFKF